VGKIVKQFNPKNPKSLALRTHCQTSGWSLTEQDPFNNVAELLLKQWQLLLVAHKVSYNALDEAIALPTDFSARIARNTQIYLQQETQYYKNSRSLGRKLSSRKTNRRYSFQSMEINPEVEELGGMTKAIEKGIPKMRIEEAAAKKQAKIDSGQDVIVGVNKYSIKRRRSFAYFRSR